MEHTLIPSAELELFNKLPNIRTVIDVGARADTEYITLKPKITLHAFEPHIPFFEQLKERIGERTNTYLNNYALGEKDEKRKYHPGLQAMMGGEAYLTSNAGEDQAQYEVKTLDWYTEEMKIKRVDFLKIDVEGMDYQVLLGAPKTLINTRFIQYEHWDDKGEFHRLLDSDFDLQYIGYRNVLCMSKTLVSEKVRADLAKFIDDRGYAALA